MHEITDKFIFDMLHQLILGGKAVCVWLASSTLFRLIVNWKHTWQTQVFKIDRGYALLVEIKEFDLFNCILVAVSTWTQLLMYCCYTQLWSVWHHLKHKQNEKKMIKLQPLNIFLSCIHSYNCLSELSTFVL